MASSSSEPLGQPAAAKSSALAGRRRSRTPSRAAGPPRHPNEAENPGSPQTPSESDIGVDFVSVHSGTPGSDIAVDFWDCVYTLLPRRISSLPTCEGEFRYYTVFPFPTVPFLRPGVWTTRGRWAERFFYSLVEQNQYTTFAAHPFLLQPTLPEAIVDFKSRARSFDLDPDADLHFVDISSPPPG